MPTEIAQTELLCPNCAGQCVYSPQAQNLKCQNCGEAREIEIDPDANPSREFHYHPDLPHTEQTSISNSSTHACQTCGGEVIFVGAALSERCPYCDGPVVRQEKDANYQTLGLIPFRIPEAEAQKNALAWVKKRRAAPNDLSEKVAASRVAGLYAPFWTFDSKEAVDYLVRYRVKRGKRTYHRTAEGSMNIFFDDLLMPASPHVTPMIRDGILHDFHPNDLRPYEPAYMAGFAAERHHQSVSQGLSANQADKRLLIRNRIKKHAGKSNVTNISYKTDTTGIHYRRILVPVWILHYKYNGAPFKVVVCGSYGRTYGERPFSRWKLAGYAGAASALLIAFGWYWGAAQLF